jgi:hypothetical protein
LSQAVQFVKNFVYIGQVEIACQDEVSGDPVIESDERVAGFNRIVTMGAVPEVAHEDFTGIGLVFFEPFTIPELLRGTIFKMLKNALENFLKVLGAIASFPTDIPGPGGWIKLDRSHTSPVLPTVAHLLEEQLHGIQSMESCAILFLVVL